MQYDTNLKVPDTFVKHSDRDMGERFMVQVSLCQGLYSLSGKTSYHQISTVLKPQDWVLK